MKIKRVVTCLPVKDLKRSTDFYKNCFQIEIPEADEGILSLEISNLDLFLIEEKEFVKYSSKSNLNSYFPKDKVQLILSCAVEDENEINEAFSNAEKFGGSVSSPISKNEWGQMIGYIQDPDGHLWEMVLTS